MAAPIETQGQLQEFLDVLRKRRWQVLLPMVFLVALGSAIAVIVPRRYKSVTTIEVMETRVAEDPLLKTPGSAAVNVELVNVQQHIRHFRKVGEILELLKWTDYLKLSEDARGDYIHRVLENITVRVAEKEKNKGSTFVQIEYVDLDGVRARMFLNRLAASWQKDVMERDILRVEREQSRALKALVDAKKERDELQKQIARSAASIGLDWKDFFAQRAGSTSNADPLYERIESSKNTLAEIETELAGLTAEIEERHSKWALEPSTVLLTDVLAGSQFTQQIAQLRNKISKLSADQEGMTKINPRYQRILAEIERYEEMIEELEAEQQETIKRTQNVPNARKADLLQQLESLQAREKALRAREINLAQRINLDQAEYDKRVGEVSKVWDLKAQLDLTVDSVAEAQMLYTAKSGILLALRGADGNPFDVAEEATAPTGPEPPSPLVIVAFAGVAGLALGLAAALLAEFSKNSYRNVTDFSRVVELPVLGVVNSIVTGDEIRRRRVRRVSVAFSSAVVIGGLAWFTWAWKARPDVLPTEVFDFLDGWRSGLR